MKPTGILSKVFFVSLSILIPLSLPAEEKSAKNTADIPSLEKALKSDEQLARRQAVRELIRMGESGEKALIKGLQSKDPVIRKVIVQALGEKGPDARRLEVLKKALSDESDDVRLTAVNILVFSKPKLPGTTELLALASKDKNQDIANTAKKETFQFYKDVVPFRERPDIKDHVESIKLAGKTDLPKTGWKFITDPDESGHLKKYFAPDFDDKAWKSIEIEKFWDDFGIKYCGAAWYRLTFKAPEKIDAAAIELIFEGIDESAWVWINGQYAGQHDIGPMGWDQKFALDATGMIKWNADNQITVRVFNMTQAGGIWKPARIEMLKLHQ